MNDKQKHFADEYIISRNATQAAIKAGYSDKTARSIGQRLLTKVDISEYIKKRTEELFDERSMSIVEALAISASIARGETQQGYSKKTVKIAEGVEVSETTYEFTPTIEERQRSIDHIFRVNGAYLERKEIEMSSAVQFVMKRRMSEFIPKAFYSMWRAAFDPKILHVVEKGGRGSGKSSDLGHTIIQLIMRYPVNAVCIRKTDNTLEQSVYEQLKWAISEQGVGHLFKINKSPLKITYIPRGNYIIFRGAQDPERIKSLKDSRFPFAIGWIEELAEFKTEDEVKTITNSLLRGELADGLLLLQPTKKKTILGE